MTSVLVTHGGGRLGIGVSRSLKAADPTNPVFAVDTNPYQLQRAVADERCLVPRASDERYLEILRHLVRKANVEVVWPNHEAEIALIAESQDGLEGAATFLPPPDVIARCQDKMVSHDLLVAAGVAVPHSMLMTKPEDLPTAFARFGSPLWVRAISGAGGKGSREVADVETGRMWIELHKGWGSFMAAECLSSKTATWESIWDQGKLVLAQGRKRLYWEFSSLTASGVTGICGAGQWLTNPIVDEIGERAVKAFTGTPHGIFAVDITYDHEDQPRVTEINCGRFMSGGLIHFPECGYNAADIVTRIALGRPLGFDTPVVNPCPEDVVLVHGMDVVRVTTTVDEVRAYQAALDGQFAIAER